MMLPKMDAHHISAGPRGKRGAGDDPLWTIMNMSRHIHNAAVEGGSNRQNRRFQAPPPPQTACSNLALAPEA
jgi:hypothetical protein